MQANLCINSAWQHSKCCTLPCRVFGAFTVMGFWKKLSQYKNYAPQRETKTKASRVWSKLLAWEQEYTFCRVCWGLFGHSIVELKVAVYCWTDVLGLLCSWQWNSPFISLLLNSYAPKQGGHIQNACWEQLLTGWTWELFHIKMVVLDQNLCQGLWHQAPRMGGWVLVPPQSIPGASVSCYCRQSSDSSAVKWKCCFCSEFSLSHISRFSTTVGFIYLCQIKSCHIWNPCGDWAVWETSSGFLVLFCCWSGETRGDCLGHDEIALQSWALCLHSSICECSALGRWKVYSWKEKKVKKPTFAVFLTRRDCQTCLVILHPRVCLNTNIWKKIFSDSIRREHSLQF